MCLVLVLVGVDEEVAGRKAGLQVIAGTWYVRAK